MTALTPVQQAARDAYAAGLNILPPREDGSKAPIDKWKQYEHRRTTRDQCQAWWGPRTGLGAICGRISGNLELFEFDDRDTYQAFKELAQQAELGDLVARLEAGYCEDTPSGGVHWLYRCSAVTGNLKLATRPKRTEEQDPADPDDDTKTLIETRGEGGYVVLAPSNGRVHPTRRPYVLRSGGFASIPILTPDERADLHNLARAFHEAPPKVQPAPPGPPRPAPSGDLRPGDDYTARTTWRELLEAHGWTAIGEQGEHTLWRRPGKRFGISATTNHAGSDLLWVFSTSTPFDAERSYDRFGAYAVLEHGGDQRAAARALAAKGYGTPRGQRQQPAEPPREQTADEGQDESSPTKSPLEFFTVRELAARVAAAGPRRWTFKGLWPAGDYGVHAAEMKAQKTWNTTEAAVSCASATPLLGRFAVDEAGPVLMFCGEGGEGNILRRIRAVAESRGIPDPDGLPIVICARVPHLGAPGHLDILRDRLRALRPALVTLDPLYLAARGANLADLYAMGALLETVQHLCAEVGSSLWITTHHNRKQGQGAMRITGAGPAEWGRVLLTADVKSRHTDPATRATSVVTVLSAIGGEIPDLALRIHRRVWADDPDDLDSPLHVETTVTDAEGDQAEGGDTLTPAATKLLEAVRAVGPATNSNLVDWIAKQYGHGLRRETVSREMGKLEERGFVDSAEVGKSKLWQERVTCDVTRDDHV